MKNLAHNGLRVGADPVSDAFYSRVMARHRQECLVEPTFTDMKAIPGAQEFISRFKSQLIFREIKTDGPGYVSEKAVLILDKNRKELGIIRWIGGQGDPFFYHLLGKRESVESILAQVPMPMATEPPAQVAVKAQAPIDASINAAQAPK